MTKTTDDEDKTERVERPAVPRPAGRFPTKGRQNAYESYVSASLNVRQTPEMFGGVSTE